MVMIFGDNLRRAQLAVATYSIAAITVAVFLLCSFDPTLAANLTKIFGFIPLDFSLHPLLKIYTLISAQFLHVDIAHLIGNLIFFVALGRSIENLIRPGPFVLAFIGLGALSFLGSWILGPNSARPIVGASGAISFLIGAYVMIFPKARLKIFPFIRFLALPAWFFAALWIAIQLYGIAFLGEHQSSVAYGTHIGGFIVGVISALVWKEFGLDTDRQIEELTRKRADG